MDCPYFWQAFFACLCLSCFRRHIYPQLFSTCPINILPDILRIIPLEKNVQRNNGDQNNTCQSAVCGSPVEMINDELSRRDKYLHSEADPGHSYSYRQPTFPVKPFWQDHSMGNKANSGNANRCNEAVPYIELPQLGNSAGCEKTEGHHTSPERDNYTGPETIDE